jgi:hypothetical protein
MPTGRIRADRILSAGHAGFPEETVARPLEFVQEALPYFLGNAIILDERDDPLGPLTPRTDQGIHFVNFLDQTCPILPEHTG